MKKLTVLRTGDGVKGHGAPEHSTAQAETLEDLSYSGHTAGSTDASHSLQDY